MYLSKGEQVSKWLLLLIYLVGIALPFIAIFRYQMHGLFAVILTVVFIFSALEFLGALIGWFMICFGKESGKKIIIQASISMIINYVISVIVFPIAFGDAFTTELFLTLSMFLIASIAALVLQHIWTKYIF